MSHRRRRVVAYLREQVALVVEGEARLDPAAPDAEAVHDLRVAVRRVRSLLRVFPGLAGSAPPGLEVALGGWASALGGVRDADVVGALVAEVSRPLAARLEPRLAQARRQAIAELAYDARSPRHAALVTAVADLPETAVLPRHARRDARRAESVARRRLGAAGDDPVRLHRARKAAKRARYACEAVGARGRAGRWKAVQERLGRHHDCIVAAAALAELPRSAIARARLLERAAQALADEPAARRRGDQ